MLTEKRIRDAKPGPKPAILWDTAIKGLGVKIQPGGTKAFVLSYRAGGRKRMATLARRRRDTIEGRPRACRGRTGSHPGRQGRPAGSAAARQEKRQPLPKRPTAS